MRNSIAAHCLLLLAITTVLLHDVLVVVEVAAVVHLVLLDWRHQLQLWALANLRGAAKLPLFTRPWISRWRSLWLT